MNNFQPEFQSFSQIIVTIIQEVLDLDGLQRSPVMSYSEGSAGKGISQLTQSAMTSQGCSNNYA